MNQPVYSTRYVSKSTNRLYSFGAFPALILRHPRAGRLGRRADEVIE
jgi:hypothetical protein